MQEVIMESVRNGNIIPVAAISLGILIGIVSVIATYWHRVRIAEMEASLKHKMLDQGMSAADIQQVLQASMGEGDKGSKRK